MGAPCGHTTFLAAREACYPAAGRHQIVSPTLGETICWASVHLRVAAEKPIAPDFVPRGERSARRKKIFFLPKKFFFLRKFFFLPEKISASEIFFPSGGCNALPDPRLPPSPGISGNFPRARGAPRA